MYFIQINTWVTEHNQIWQQLLHGFEPFARRMHIQYMQYREEKNPHPFHIKSKRTWPVPQTRTIDACIMKKWPVWKSCREQTTLIIVINYRHQFFPTCKLRHGKPISWCSWCSLCQKNYNISCTCMFFSNHWVLNHGYLTYDLKLSLYSSKAM